MNPGHIVSDAGSIAVRHCGATSLPVVGAWGDVLCGLQAIAAGSHVTSACV
ncbi:hypothetical protein XMIN_1022 [Xanthomonas citri pv. mangiferaeindicae LMG 941]|nr:hypothetical protein XMIN_1022 [Xanthomonas citri pv. mangiferaeindicae LMG 941]